MVAGRRTVGGLGVLPHDSCECPCGESLDTRPGAVRVFDTGATRSNDAERIDPEGFLSPLALERYSEYLHKHRLQPDGSVRDSDNWQKGIPLDAYMKGLLRHVLHLWQRHRGWTVVDPKAGVDIQEDLCAIIFNAQGYLHELLKTGRRANEE